MSFLRFTHVSEEAATALRLSTSAEEAAKVIQEKTALLSRNLTNGQQIVELELFVNNLRFCLEEKFDVAQISTYLSVIREVVSFGIDRRASDGAAWKHFETCVLAHAADRPPFAINVFRFEELRAIFSFAERNFIRLYPLYMRVFLPELHLEISACARGEEPVPPEPLTEAEQIDKELIYEFNRPSEKDESELIAAVLAKYQ